MKIYWKIVIWNFTIRYWNMLIAFLYQKDAIWQDLHYCYNRRMWNSKQWADCEKAFASLLPKLDDIIRRVTAKDDTITTIVSTGADQKMYKSGKVIAMRKSLGNQTDNSTN